MFPDASMLASVSPLASVTVRVFVVTPGIPVKVTPLAGDSDRTKMGLNPPVAGSHTAEPVDDVKAANAVVKPVSESAEEFQTQFRSLRY